MRNALADADAGRVVFLESILPEHRRAEMTSPYDHALSDVPQAADFVGPLHGPVPVRVTATWTADGLHLRLRNEGRKDLAVDPVGLRYGFAEKVVVTTTPAGGATTSETRFRLDLGADGVHAVVPAKWLVPLPVGGTYECDLPVLPEFRGAPNLDVRIGGWSFTVAGPSSAPVVRFDWTRVL